MTNTLEFYFDFGSPTSYLAHSRFPWFRSRYEVTIVYKAMLLGAVLKATNNHSPVTVPAKGAYMLRHDLPRFARRYGVPMVVNKHFPINTLTLMRGTYAAQHLDVHERYCEVVFHAMWAENLNMGESGVFVKALDNGGLDGTQILALTEDPAIKEALQATTQEAIARGCFGAPTMFINDEMFFGQDRLDFIEEILASRSL